MNISDEINIAIYRAGGQKAVAALWGCSVPYVSQVVSGQRGITLERLDALLAKFGTRVAVENMPTEAITLAVKVFENLVQASALIMERQEARRSEEQTERKMRDALCGR